MNYWEKYLDECNKLLFGFYMLVTVSTDGVKALFILQYATKCKLCWEVN